MIRRERGWIMRFDLSDEEWALLEPLMPNSRKSARSDDRKIMNGIFYVLRTGMPWRDLPARYGPYTTVYNRFNRWSRRGIWKRIFDQLASKSRDSLHLIDSTIVKAHRAASGAKQPGWSKHENPCCGRQQGSAVACLALRAAFPRRSTAWVSGLIATVAEIRPKAASQAQIPTQSAMIRPKLETVRDWAIGSLSSALVQVWIHAPRVRVSSSLFGRLGARRLRAGDARAGFAGQLDAERPAIAGQCALCPGADSRRIPAAHRRLSPQGGSRHYRGRYE